MLTVEQVSSLCKDRQYKKTKGTKYSLKFYALVVSGPDFSILDINIGGKPSQQVNILMKVFYWLFKRIIISLEISDFRNAIIERILNSSLDNVFCISSLIKPNMKWVEANGLKMDYIRRFTEEFVTNSEIQQIIFNAIK